MKKNRVIFILLILTFFSACSGQPQMPASEPLQNDESDEPSYNDRDLDYLEIGVVSTNSENPAGDYEPFLLTADLNEDGLDDILVERSLFISFNTYPIEILLNNGSGGFEVATSNLFEGDIPVVQNPTKTIFADFNGDKRMDFFIADHGYDETPHPGFQNVLVLSTESGYQDASSRLPQQSDFTHDVSSGDIDNDGDIDVYVGNIWGEKDLNPFILRNNGNGEFTSDFEALPPLMTLSQNGFTTSELVDVDNDGDVDLVLGDAGDDITNEYSTSTSEVLNNDGSGKFFRLANAFPSKTNANSDICHDILPFDFNKDGFIDFFFVQQKYGTGGSYIEVLINRKDGTFTIETDSWLKSPAHSVWLPSLELRDLDHDGYLDLYARNWDANNPNPVVFFNDTNNFFTYTLVDFKLPYLYYSFLDMDSDGGNDLAYATLDPAESIHLIKDQSR